ncbi:contactin-associated protein-like 5 [Clytia hemisphaerica]|uniref:contactin-associated protein-like 5 n=1 Tax=Clytia hemisphaerica TaxID=252671 RepID=UPI0034D71CAF
MKTILLINVLFLVNICHCVTYTYPGKGFTKFPILKSSQTTKISFEFQTSSLEVERSLLYVDNVRGGGMEGDSMRVWLDAGRLKIAWNVVNGNYRDGDIKEVGHNLDDNIKHYVVIERFNGKHFVVRVDGVESRRSFSKAVRFNSEVYLGGCHPDPTKRTLQRDPYFCFQNGFIGCISGLRWSTESEEDERTFKPIETYNVTKGCTNRCLTDPSFSCSNRGRCLNQYIKTGCDCRGTGFTGTTCQKPKLAVTFFGEQYVTWVPQTSMNNLVTNIFVRFKSNQPSGIILFITGQSTSEFMLLELYERTLVLKIKINGYDEKVFKIPKSTNEKAEYWQMVSFSRMGASITIAMDDGVHEYTNSVKQLENKVVHVKFIIKKIYFGGVDKLRDGDFALRKSESKINFIGCLQNVDVNQFDLVENIASRSPNDKSISLFGGSLQKGACKVLPVIGSKQTPTPRVEEFITPHTFTETLHNKTLSNLLSAQNDEEDSKSLLWIIVGSCVSLIVLMIVVCLVVRHIKKRKEEHRRYRDHYLRQTAMRVEREDLLPTEKCIRDEVEKRNMQSFSPLRKEFYVATMSRAGTLQRSVHHEPIYQSHEVFHHAHPCLGKNYAVPSINTPQRSQSPASSNYGTSRKCSHASARYQTPNVNVNAAAPESVKSMSSSSGL